ncbi:hypothetical protein C9374_002086 [Naegleria lovaniensis]|uniref:Uncharacterized protein n=1 Tax=Naegleria lovaniensis TaxID=51637 RepID=A0AA88GW78_NAELO|nr:uncharacterized protein C9374_002086 [Naegleria lovaniensis]KAG2387051.1 hypothetical protein C9374_002086 [Naegleria lovaniensis]
MIEWKLEKDPFMIQSSSSSSSTSVGEVRTITSSETLLDRPTIESTIQAYNSMKAFQEMDCHRMINRKQVEFTQHQEEIFSTLSSTTMDDSSFNSVITPSSEILSFQQLADDEMCCVMDFLVNDIPTVMAVSTCCKRFRFLVLEKLNLEQLYFHRILLCDESVHYLRNKLLIQVLFKNSLEFRKWCAVTKRQAAKLHVDDSSSISSTTLEVSTSASDITQESHDDYHTLDHLIVEKKNSYKILYYNLFSNCLDLIVEKASQEICHSTVTTPQIDKSNMYNLFQQLTYSVIDFQQNEITFERELAWGISNQNLIIQDRLIKTLFSLHLLTLLTIIVSQFIMHDQLLESIILLFLFSVTLGVTLTLCWTIGHFPLFSWFYWLYHGSLDLFHIEEQCNLMTNANQNGASHLLEKKEISKHVSTLHMHGIALLKHFRLARSYFIYYYHLLMKSQLKQVVRELCIKNNVKEQFQMRFEMLCHNAWWNSLIDLSDDILSTRFFICVFDIVPVLAFSLWLGNSSLHKYVNHEILKAVRFLIIHGSLLVSSIELFDIVRSYIVTNNNTFSECSIKLRERRQKAEDTIKWKEGIILFIRRPLAMFLLMVIRIYFVSSVVSYTQ